MNTNTTSANPELEQVRRAIEFGSFAFVPSFEGKQGLKVTCEGEIASVGIFRHNNLLGTVEVDHLGRTTRQDFGRLDCVPENILLTVENGLRADRSAYGSSLRWLYSTEPTRSVQENNQGETSPSSLDKTNFILTFCQ